MINKEEIERIQKEIEAYKKFKNQKCTMTLFEEFFDDIENLLNEYLREKELNKEHQKLNGKLQQKLTEHEEIDNKEARDALHMLLHCALKDKEFETQKEQFNIVMAYIKKLEEIIKGKAIQEMGVSDLYKED